MREFFALSTDRTRLRRHFKQVQNTMFEQEFLGLKNVEVRIAVQFQSSHISDKILQYAVNP